MSKTKLLRAILSEYGMGWATSRLLYSIKLKILGMVPPTGKLFEKSISYPKRLDIFEIDVDTLRMFIRNTLSDSDKNHLISIADKACKGIITGFSSVELNYGDPIDWQSNPLTGKRCDEKKKWYKIPDFDRECGDIKVIWEASRFSHFITLSRAYLLTDNEKYYRAFSDQLKGWLEKNQYSYGANFKCGQECSFRMVNALLAYTVFRATKISTDSDASCMKDLVDRCYRKILSNFSYAYKCIKNNHTISELMGMIVGAWCCDDQKQLVKAYKLLEEVVNEQFKKDGGYCQFSFNYQRLALQDLEVVLSISTKTGIVLKPNIRERIGNSAMLMYQCQDDSGDMPNYGNNDGALVFPVTACGYWDFRPVINTVNALITSKQLYDAGLHQEELIWFSGYKRANKYAIEKKKRISSQFTDAGLFTIRMSNFWAMVVSNNYTSRPGHMDQLHFDLWIDGVNVLCDSGTYSYASELGRQLVRNEGHNTVLVDEMPQMNSRGPFMIYDWTKREMCAYDNNSFEGKIISANGYSHVRKIKQSRMVFEIIDKVDKDYHILFHTPCAVEIIGEKVILSQNGKRLCEIICTGKIELLKTKRSLFYLREEEINCLVFSNQAGKIITTKIKIIEGESKYD